MAQVYQKREIVLLDIHNRISKNMIDSVLESNGYQLSSSKIDNRPNVEFINADVANGVKKFFDNKELIYNNRPFKFSLKGNRFIIGGMHDVPYDKIKNFFQTYGEVNNVYSTKRYFATLASIQQAIELVEKVKIIKIDNIPVEIKYAFDHNIGNSVSSNKNFKLRVKDDTKTSEFVVKNKVLINDQNSRQNINIELSKPVNIELGGIKSSNSTSRLNLNDADKFKQSNKNRSNQHFGSQQNIQQQYNDKKNRRRRDRGRNKSSSSETTQQFSELDLNKKSKYKYINPALGSKSNLQDVSKKSEQSNVSKLVDPKVNSLKMSNQPLFSKGPTSNGSSIFEKLDHKNGQFKSINYLDDKVKQQEKQPTHVTTTYFNPSLNKERQQNDTNIPTVLPFQKINTNQNSQNVSSFSNSTSTIENKTFKPSSTVTPLTSLNSNSSSTQRYTKPENKNTMNQHTPSTRPKTNVKNADSYNLQDDPDKKKNYYTTRQEPTKKERDANCNII